MSNAVRITKQTLKYFNDFFFELFLKFVAEYIGSSTLNL